MKREIKFRAWIPKLGSEIKYPKMGLMFTWPLQFSECNGAIQGIKHNTVMQYTGLKDKNGKEIYEGDLLRQWDDIFLITPMERGSFGITVYKELKNGGVVEDSSYVISALSSCEIIGNIYENPELLEAKK